MWLPSPSPSHMNSTAFENLPNEIILLIIEVLWNDARINLYRLRLVSRRLDALVTPVLFSEARISLGYFPETANLCNELTTGLVTWPINAFENIKRLKVGMNLTHPHYQHWELLLFVLLSHVQQLRSIIWDFYPPYYSVSGLKFIYRLASIQTLTEISITLHNHPSSPEEFSLKPLSGLRAISIRWHNRKQPKRHFNSEVSGLIARCPGLEYLSIALDRDFQYKVEVKFSKIFPAALRLPLRIKRLELKGITITPSDFEQSMHHFRQLETLALEGRSFRPFTGDYFGGIWRLLQREEIPLKHITTSVLHPPTFTAYLLSYSGLRTLCLKPERRPDESSELADHLFNSVFPKHRSSLTLVEFGVVGKATTWCMSLSTDYWDLLGLCKERRRDGVVLR